jgi:TM2 domain-containing membrane protein YozV
MARQSPHLPDDLREPLDLEWPGFARFYLKAIGIAILVGLISGALWIAWNLVKLHVLQWV